MNRIDQTSAMTETGGRGDEGLSPVQVVAEIANDSTPQAINKEARKWKWSRTTISFFLMGIFVGLPTMPITTAANQMFEGITGVYGICLSLTAAVSAFVGPMVARYVPFDIVTIALTLASGLAYVISTLPSPLSNTGGNKAGPVIGTMLAGFVYAFGTQNYLAVAAFFPPEAVVALSVGSGLSIILGSGIFIALMEGPFHQDWRRCFLVFLPTTLGIPLVWWCLFDKKRRSAAEFCRKQGLQKGRDTSSSSEMGTVVEEDKKNQTSINITAPDSNDMPHNSKPSFGPGRSRAGLLFKTLLPHYVLPLILCTTCAILSLFGLAPILQELGRFKGSPKGDMEFQLVFFAYGSAQFLFSTLVIWKPIPNIWLWTGAEIALTAMAIIQLWYPFLTYFGIWFVIMFMVGGCVGGSVTNTNYKIAEDFQRAGEPDDVRSFANSYAGLGNFGGDALGGALGLVFQKVIAKYLSPSSA